ncbi:hypothetical protein BATDEDRAFT_19033 [Batrachochytrium dendrobatidis JAM81]|uniref:Peptidase M20 dimerisation domain-containing protein n=2 Tax=Batrachochytrium dendrobatidis TaxID=109871 RepID=F4NXM0_BATDJ|nr:metallodipeptidase [Batrachochytrium dendrobatidis JAM81]EGF81867.1 hypothetical protein BATDEDRAFT_19033 [Batrachochytrium dendrobatidis JAM81]KAJ8324582.1 hypothetical protein O5D80_006827 [Batrachochytrium dendrobatidis]KAK5670830.1 hypothetical protein QVD99_002599 [Batrachochytrium dendrobatidis]OAJ40495.1 hypothetical protein BDEG_24221 [Batrachochytrium dendrobatidis JEL423]|eukprot:XP_006677201.1 hypothetical protein BATDEDRAFT_19033 [Batrachochytrium dendrobatidis JAM81]
MVSDSVNNYIDEHQNYFVQRLAETVAIPSVSSSAAHRPDVVRMGFWLEKELKGLGASVELRYPGKQQLEGREIDLPPIVLATYGTDPNKKTVLVYGHYDVQPALKEDGWATDPFTLVEDDKGRMFGRGSTDDKGPVISWLWVIQIHQKLGLDLPVNLKMCFEGMEESGSEGLDELIYKEAALYFKDVDCVCISDNYWLGTTKPCITYGLRGVSYFMLTVSGPGKDLHSGVFGGTVHEPMTDLVHLMQKLVTPDGKILVPGIMDDVAPVTSEEDAIYKALDFSMNDIYNAIDAKNTIHDTEKNVLMSRWRFPSLSLHGIEGAFYSPGAKTVIPAKVIGKFSIRSVPNQEPAKLTKQVVDYIMSEFAKLGSKNTVHVECEHAGKSWVADINSWNYVAATKAVQKVFNVTPDYTREGGSIPVTLSFQEALKKSVLLLPMGRSDDGAHSINEKLDRSNYIQGIKLLSAYLYEVSTVQS